MFSFTLEIEDGRTVPLIQYVVGLAVTEAVKSVCDKKGLPYTDVKIKWRNDIYLNSLKIGGVLPQRTDQRSVGLNVDNEQPTTCLNAVLKDLSPMSDLFKKKNFLVPSLIRLKRYLIYSCAQRFISKDMASQVTVMSSVAFSVWLLSVKGFKSRSFTTGHGFTGLTSSGYLLAIGDDNQMYELHPDGNSFDFLKGLVRRKL
ncbi:hypothetical protein IGI04_033561 [Brassica rapa subsp. trilocularis]|uniref:BPL/LPL catalytic domain-containing protein n=1 Tax=Brassica rapa subsp. trilocularis TaxID=1813537 RepID=A0ABQ7L8J2_BRACM|nr:hypothetical protein IGI04_033561 [Brassica rapa subsp. trilocularis]